jgi:hypothetical protein
MIEDADLHEFKPFLLFLSMEQFLGGFCQAKVDLPSPYGMVRPSVSSKDAQILGRAA